MLNSKITLPRLAAFGALALLGACSQMYPYHAAEIAPVSNPPPVAPGPQAIWYHVAFNTGSFAIDADGQGVVSNVVTYLVQNPTAEATIIG